MVKLAISIFHGHWPAVDSLGLWIFKYLGASGYIWIKVYLGALTRGTMKFFCDFMGIFPTSASHSSSQYGNLFFGTKIPKIRPLLTILNWLYSQKCEDPSPSLKNPIFDSVSMSAVHFCLYGYLATTDKFYRLPTSTISIIIHCEQYQPNKVAHN